MITLYFNTVKTEFLLDFNSCLYLYVCLFLAEFMLIWQLLLNGVKVISRGEIKKIMYSTNIFTKFIEFLLHCIVFPTIRTGFRFDVVQICYFLQICYRTVVLYV